MEQTLRTRSFGRAALALLALLPLVLGNAACIQEISLEPSSSVVTVTWEQPLDESPVGIRTTLAGTGLDLLTNDWGFADEYGATTVKTSVLQRTWAVGRSDRHDVAYGPVDVQAYGQTYAVTSVVGMAGTTPTTVVPPRLERKRIGEVLLCYFEQDWPNGPVDRVQVCGEDVHFEPSKGLRDLYDDGSNGDFVAGDGVHSVRFSTATTSFGYGFVVNGHTDRVLRDPHEEHSELFVDRDGFIVRRSVIKVRTEL